MAVDPSTQDHLEWVWKITSPWGVCHKTVGIRVIKNSITRYVTRKNENSRLCIEGYAMKQQTQDLEIGKFLK